MEFFSVCRVCLAGKDPSICLPPIALIKHTLLLFLALPSLQKFGDTTVAAKMTVQSGNYAGQGRRALKSLSTTGMVREVRNGVRLKHSEKHFEKYLLLCV